MTKSSAPTMEELLHLKQGSTHPPLKKGSQRIYSMRFCPYAQRSLLVAEAKGINYDVVNVDLSDKADWFLKLNPRGQVPTLEFEDATHLTESLIVCDYLDEKYSDSRPLYPRDPILKAKDRLLIERFNEIITHMFKLFLSANNPDRDLGPFEMIRNKLELFENEIVTRGSPYFGGSAAGMLDYMIWPWFERAGMLVGFGGSDLDLFNGQFPQLKQWCTAMTKDSAVQKWFLESKIHAHYLQSRLDGKPDYDYLVKSKY